VQYRVRGGVALAGVRGQWSGNPGQLDQFGEVNEMIPLAVVIDETTLIPISVAFASIVALLAPCIAVWRKLVAIDSRLERMERISKHRMGRAEFELWATRLQRDNPEIRVPAVLAYADEADE